jgi:phage gp16-like protein
MHFHTTARVVGVAIAAIILAAEVCPAVASPQGYALVSVQMSMGRPGFTSLPPTRKRQTAPTKPTPQANTGLADAINRLSPSDRKKLAKQFKKLTPQQRSRVLAAIQGQAANKTGAAR